MEHLLSFLCIPVLMLIGWVMSDDKRRFPWRVVLWGTGLQFLFALIIMWSSWGRTAFEWLGNATTNFLGFAQNGAEFLFGNLVKPEYTQTFGFQFAFAILPTIIFFASVMAVGYHFGIMQRIVKWIAWVMSKSMRTSGAESLSCAANIFLGQTEAPFLIRPFLSTLTRSELNAVMVGGFATIAGGVMAGYIALGIPAKHLLAASVMSAPAALVFAKIVAPEKEQPLTAGQVRLPEMPRHANVIDAAASGAIDGLKLAVNVGAMLLAFIALIAVLNWVLSYCSDQLNVLGFSYFPSSLKQIFSVLFWPIAFLLGVPVKECMDFGYLLGTQMSVNEFVAFVDLSNMIKAGTLSPRAIALASYALCGFANFSSVAIQIGGISGLAPDRRKDLAQLGLRAMIAGNLASYQTAAIAGMLIK